MFNKPANINLGDSTIPHPTLINNAEEIKDLIFDP